MNTTHDKTEAIGIDVGGTYIKAGRVGHDGRVIRLLEPIPTTPELGPGHVIKLIVEAVEALRTGSAAEVGIGMPGLVSTDCSTVKYPPNFQGWEVVDLGGEVASATGARVIVDNDANCAALGEARFGAGKRIASFILATLGTGVGGGIIIDGQLYRGENGGAGEIGHTTVDIRGIQCKCGSFGCVETYIGNNYFVERVWKGLASHLESALHTSVKSKFELTPIRIAEAANNGDAYAREEMRIAGYSLGAGLANAMGLFDIHTAVLGGGIAQAGKMLFEDIRVGITRFSQPPIAKSFRLLPAELGTHAGVLGAASLTF